MQHRNMLSPKPIQSQSCILLAKPIGFAFNEQTAEDNVFQKEDKINTKKDIRDKALEEWSNYLVILKSKCIKTFVYEDTVEPSKPDAIFCRDWNSFHDNGLVILYPIKCKNRRLERRSDVIEDIGKQYEIKEVFSLAYGEDNEKFLEGSGAIVFDHANHKMYVNESSRSNLELTQIVAKKLDYEAISFKAKDQNHKPIYHADVALTIGTDWAIICDDAFEDKQDLENIRHSLKETGHEIVSINFDQMNNFTANCFEAISEDNQRYIIMSETAVKTLKREQRDVLEKNCKIISVDIHTIEQNGGSIRCMSADIRLTPKSQNA